MVNKMGSIWYFFKQMTVFNELKSVVEIRKGFQRGQQSWLPLSFLSRSFFEKREMIPAGLPIPGPALLWRRSCASLPGCRFRNVVTGAHDRVAGSSLKCPPTDRGRFNLWMQGFALSKRHRPSLCTLGHIGPNRPRRYPKSLPPRDGSGRRGILRLSAAESGDGR